MPSPRDASDPVEIAAMFDKVAQDYDRTNTLLSAGIDRYWRRATRAALNLAPTDRCLDLAAGTAVSTAELAQTGATVIGCDFSLGMLHAARHTRGAAIPLVAGDAMALPFRTASFDAVTMTFGLRNVADVPQVLAELRRVTRPGGRLVICEFSRPHYAIVRWAHESYLGTLLPVLARLTSKERDAYAYLSRSIQNWPDQRQLASTIEAAGWKGVEWRDLTFGAVALHRATR